MAWTVELSVRKRYGGNGWIDAVDHEDMTPAMRRRFNEETAADFQRDN